MNNGGGGRGGGRGGGGGEFFQMEDVAKKLTLWHTGTFRPILTHEELDPIMASAGFVALPMSATNAGGHVAWREYAFRSESRGGADAGGFLPRPRLPFPRIDGLHLLAYQAFFDALEFYLGAHQVPDLFHVRYGTSTTSSLSPLCPLERFLFTDLPFSCLF